MTQSLRKWCKLIPENEQLANELHKPIIRKFEKGKVYSTLLKKLKILFRGLMLFNDLNGEEIIGTFYEKELQKQIKNNSELKK